jgi:hypothetical protein
LDLSGFLLNHQRRHHDYSLSRLMMAGNNRRNPMIKTLNLIAATALSLLAFQQTAIAQDAAAKTGHVTLNKRCDVSAQGSCDGAVHTSAAEDRAEDKKGYVGHVTLNKRTAKPVDEIPGCGPVQYGVASSSTC